MHHKISTSDFTLMILFMCHHNPVPEDSISRWRNWHTLYIWIPHIQCHAKTRLLSTFRRSWGLACRSRSLEPEFEGSNPAPDSSYPLLPDLPRWETSLPLWQTLLHLPHQDGLKLPQHDGLSAMSQNCPPSLELSGSMTTESEKQQVHLYTAISPCLSPSQHSSVSAVSILHRRTQKVCVLCVGHFSFTIMFSGAIQVVVFVVIEWQF